MNAVEILSVSMEKPSPIEKLIFVRMKVCHVLYPMIRNKKDLCIDERRMSLTILYIDVILIRKQCLKKENSTREKE